MGSSHWISRALCMAAVAVAAFVGLGCEPGNPNATDIEKPVVTGDAPKSSEEAAQQAAPPTVETKGGKRAR